MILLPIAGLFGTLYLLINSWLYFNQEAMIFQPDKLPKSHRFSFSGKYEEIEIQVEDSINLHGILFKAENSKGLVFYLHGNGGSLDGWGHESATYTDLDYDIFMLDYRGYGKSEGHINNQERFYNDIKKAYTVFLERYPENKIIIVGYSIGTGPAAMLAASNHPRLLLLQAPYYSLEQMIDGAAPYMPRFLQKYDFMTYEFLQDTQAPVIIFHGTSDKIIPYSNSLQLEKHFKEGDTLITLEGAGHNGMNGNSAFKNHLDKILKL